MSHQLESELAPSAASGEASVSNRRKGLRPAIIFTCACIVFVVLGTGLLLTTLPFSDEGFYGVPAYFLAAEHMLKDPVLESAGLPVMTGIHQILYWMVPLGMLIQAAAFKIFGFSLYVQRSVSLLSGFGVLVLWYRVVSRLMSKEVAACACLVLSVDFIFTSLASRGRADMMALFFAVAGLAVYLQWRHRSLWASLMVANTCCAISGLTHPNVGLAGLFSLALTVVYLDRSRIGRAEIVSALVPYLVVGAGWAIWIAQNPTFFADQFLGNARSRVPEGFGRAIAGEAGRYLRAWGFTTDSRAAEARVLIPAAYAIAIAGCIAVRKKWPRLTLFLLLALIQVATLFVFEGTKQGWYLLSCTPVLDTLFAVWILQLARWRTPVARLTLAFQVLVLCGMAAGLVSVIAKRHFQTEYLPATQYLNRHLQSGETVFGRSELLYRLRCRSCLIDDEHLGANSGKTADFIVIDADYEENLSHLAHSHPGQYRWIQHLLAANYKLVYNEPAYRIYRRIS